MRSDVQKIVQEALYRAAAETATPTMVVSQRALEHIVDIASARPYVPPNTMPPDGATPGERLRKLRRALGVNAGDLGRQVALVLGREKPISAVTVRAHETGQNGITPEQAKAYADALGVTPAWLLYGEERTA